MQLEQYIDYTNLKPDATRADIEELCKIAKERGYANVCVNGAYVALCRQLLRGSGVGVACVVGFPLGASTTEVKAFEAAKAVEDGADEIAKQAYLFFEKIPVKESRLTLPVAENILVFAATAIVE